MSESSKRFSQSYIRGSARFIELQEELLTSLILAEMLLASGEENEEGAASYCKSRFGWYIERFFEQRARVYSNEAWQRSYGIVVRDDSTGRFVCPMRVTVLENVNFEKEWNGAFEGTGKLS